MCCCQAAELLQALGLQSSWPKLDILLCKQLSAHSARWAQLSQQVSGKQHCNHMCSTTNLLTLINLKLLTHILEALGLPGTLNELLQQQKTQLIEPNLIKTVLKHNNRTTHHTNKAHLIIFHPIFQGYSYYAPSINHNLKKSFAHLFIKVIVAQFMSVSL